MRNYVNDMFHDERAHDLERRFALLAGVAFAIGVLHWVFYHVI